MNAPRIVVTGAPAAGKTTICRLLTPLWAAHCGSYLDVAVDSILRDLHATGRLLGDAKVTSDGALLLSQPALSVPHAMEVLFARIRDYHGPLMVEVPLDANWLRRFTRHRSLAEGSFVILLHAPTSVRLERNRTRSHDRIRPGGLRAMPATIEPDVLRQIAQRVGILLTVNTSGTRFQTEDLVYQTAASYLRAKTADPGLRNS